MLGNSGSFIAFRIGAEDADLVAAHLGLGNPAAVKDLSNFRALGRFLIDNSPTEPTHLQLYEPPAVVNRRPDKLIANSRIRFGRDRRTVEKRIERFLSP